jgi:hypothetical protein
MPLISLRDNSEIDVEIRDAKISDVEGLMVLNKKWQKIALGEDIKDGYIGAAFTRETFLELIEKKQVSVTQFNNCIVGYYLLNNVSKDGIIGKHEDFVEEMRSKGVLNRTNNICVGAQAVVDSEFMGSPLRFMMLQNLINNVKSSYDHLFATIAKDNPRAHKAHTRDGWKVIGENEDLFFVVFEV